MPELPEVETIRRDLEIALTGRTLRSVEVRDARLMSDAETERWRRVAVGDAWQRFERLGKYLSIHTAAGRQIIFHLRMTGQLVLSEQSGRHWRMKLAFDEGRALYFYDQRRFGEAWLVEPGQPWPSKTALGPDAWTALNRDHFVKMLRGRKAPIHAFLLDQRRLAGVGNIYSQEALFKAAIRPSRPAHRLSRAEADRLYHSLHATLQAAIEARGSTSRNYLDALGKSGTAQLKHAVYRKAGRPCGVCGSALKPSRVGGRGAVFCPKCQR